MAVSQARSSRLEVVWMMAVDHQEAKGAASRWIKLPFAERVPAGRRPAGRIAAQSAPRRTQIIPRPSNDLRFESALTAQSALKSWAGGFRALPERRRRASQQIAARARIGA